jgi:hypothetical protein
MIGRAEMSDEEWEALHRINRGAPESRLVPPLMVAFLIEHGLAQERRGALMVSDAGKRLLLRHKNG